MSRGINKVILVGNLGADPEIRSLPSGITIANIRIATSEAWQDKQSGERKEQTEWHSVAFFGRLAEVAGEYLRKGSQVYVEGKLRTRKWQDKSGNDRYTTEVIGQEMQMLGSPRRIPNSAALQSNAPATTPPSPAPAMQDFDDDIPF